LTGATPVRPEIDEYRNAGVLDNLVEESGVDGDGLVDWGQRVLARSATASVGEVRGGDAVLGAAVLAGSNERHGGLRRRYDFTVIYQMCGSTVPTQA
jgi:hypothetical protein